MPDTSLMLELCGILGISVNELLSGERITMENNQQKNQELLLELSRTVEQKNKTLWTAMWVILTVSFIGFLAVVFATRFLISSATWQLITVLGACLVFLPPCFYALKLEVSIGAYKCGCCGHEIKPTYLQVLCAMHVGTTRYLKCLGCGKRSWCKKVIKK